MQKLFLGVGAAALVLGGWLAGSAGCGTANAGEGGGAACACPAPEVAEEPCIGANGGKATHVYPGLKMRDLGGVTVLVVDKDGRGSGALPAVEDGAVHVECYPGAASAIFTRPGS